MSNQSEGSAGARPEVQGECSPKFARVKDCFARLFAEGRETGAAVAVTVDGEPVVDLWGGWRDQAGSLPWERDTIVNVYSTTKGITAICAHRLIEEGRLDLDRPVAEYWPEFAQAGKEKLPVRYLLDHRAGLPAVREVLQPETLYDWDAMCAALAAETPWWEPGSKHGYHAVTYGWLVGELIRRITGKSPGTYCRDELVIPLGLDLYIGLPESEDGRTAEMSALPMESAPGEPNLAELILGDPMSVCSKAFANPPTLAMPGVVNSREWRAAELPAANGHTNARSLARIYGALASDGDLEGAHVLAPTTIEQARTEQCYGRDEVLTVSTRIGLGFMLPQPEVAPFGANREAFGHPGAGGSLGFADPEGRVGFGYVMNRMGPHILLDPRPRELADAVYECL